MGIIDGFVGQQEYIEKAIEFFDYGFEVDFENTPKEELNRIHRLLCKLEAEWTITAMQIVRDSKSFRDVTHCG